MLKFLSVNLIRFYQKFISAALNSNCPFTPTCSQYAIEAILKRGFFIGAALGAWRILRCNPFTKGGFDKVPDRRSDLKWVF